MQRCAFWVRVVLVFGWIGCFAWRADQVWNATHSPVSEDIDGPVVLASDPDPGNTLLAIFLVNGKRYYSYLNGMNARRLANAMAGESVNVTGRLADGVPRYLQVRHVVGRIDIDHVDERIGAGSPIARSTNNMRRAISNGARFMSVENSSLFTGLVIGDDRNQPPEMVRSFRSAGMSHLTAVSGQNVALVLTIFTPILVRLAPRTRFVITLLLLGWFVLLTRAEPSVLRAVGMAGVNAYGFMRGEQRRSITVLLAAGCAFLLIDPLLAWSPGWWLSVSASFGISVLSKPIAQRIPGPRPIAELLGATSAAQLATTPISLLVFGRIAPLGLIANVLSVPIAGLVMLVGLPVGLCAGITPPWIGQVLMWPIGIGVAWVKFVAQLCDLR